MYIYFHGTSITSIGFIVSRKLKLKEHTNTLDSQFTTNKLTFTQRNIYNLEQSLIHILNHKNKYIYTFIYYI